MARFSILFIALFAQVTLLYCQDEDVIVRSDGKPIPPLTVTHDDYLYVSGKHVVEYKVPSYAIKDVAYMGRNEDYDIGVQKIADEKYSVAALHFKTALNGAGESKWALELYNYQLGNTLFLNGSYAGYAGRRFNYEPPATYYKRALDANSKSRFMLDIVAKRPVCLAGEGDFDAASAALKEGERRLAAYETETAATHDPLYTPAAQRARAALSIAAARVELFKVEAKKCDWKNVCDAWRNAAQKTAAFVDLSQTAQRGWLNALVEAQDFEGAKEKSAEIIQKFVSDPDCRQWSLLSTAYFILGRVQYRSALDDIKKGRLAQSRSGFADARWSFVNAAVYGLDSGDSARARLLAGHCCEMLKDVEEDGAEKAVRYWKDVLRSNPDGGDR